MARMTKKLYIFSDLQWAEIHEIVEKIIIEMQTFLTKYNNPKEFANKYLKSVQAIVFDILATVSLNMKPDESISLMELGKKLPEEFQDSTKSQYLKPYQIREVMNVLQDQGYYDRSERTRRRGKPKVYENVSQTRNGRPPLIYKITKQVVKLQKFLSNSAVQNYIHNRLKKYNLIQQYIKFLLLSSIYALRKLDENEKVEMFELLTTFYFSDELIKNMNLSSWKDFINTMLSLDETKLDSIAEKISLYLSENPVFYFYSLDALPKWT
jgi:hypothetical protein